MGALLGIACCCIPNIRPAIQNLRSIFLKIPKKLSSITESDGSQLPGAARGIHQFRISIAEIDNPTAFVVVFPTIDSFQTT